MFRTQQCCVQDDILAQIAKWIFQVVHKLYIGVIFISPSFTPIKKEIHPPAIYFCVEINTIWLAIEAHNMAN